MKFNKKIRIFALVCALFVLLFTVAALATDVDAPTENESVVETQPASNKLDMDMKPTDLRERAEIALQGTITGMLMVFAVLGLLFGIVSLSKVFLYDIPNRDKNKSKKQITNAPVASPAPAPVAEPAPEVEDSADDGELAAVITAAIAAMLDSEEYKNEFVGGFRVVSFKRSANSAWNKK